MAPKPGDTVRVHYRGTLSDGTEFDSSEGREPLEFVVGSGQVIPGFDGAVLGLEPGDSVTVTIPAAEAYGDHDDEGLQQFPLDAFPSAPEVGWARRALRARRRSASRRSSSKSVRSPSSLDFNHPLAGQDLTFEIELVEVSRGVSVDSTA